MSSYDRRIRDKITPGTRILDYLVMNITWGGHVTGR
jgi:hypothetical protein